MANATLTNKISCHRNLRKRKSQLGIMINKTQKTKIDRMRTKTWLMRISSKRLIRMSRSKKRVKRRLIKKRKRMAVRYLWIETPMSLRMKLSKKKTKT